MFNKVELLSTLIIFTRYPEPGKTKTRMIPALGAEGAAELQRQMSEHTLKTAQQWQKSSGGNIAIYFAGGNVSLMSNWLGKNLTYYPQVTGDLGDRMKSAFNQAFDNGATRVVIIGIDCPDINLTLLNQAFSSLAKQDLVLGKAEDGGYYLIGLNYLIPKLFQNINWGTSQVLAQTQNIANSLNLNTAYLPMLRDVDRPEDLFIWQKYQ
ncbi:MAG: TIGR04282 family arsenosugar biosynthesis glycosyltransferase [Xenococcaceae cyanobacterium MO_167.B52]|nr:TIGR04282 family arsenosugar biosynthesis glycosyltransferase [Xenococcaceae cyanobacterium MO_167.B52]